MADKKSFLLYHDIRVPLELLDDTDRGKLFLAILNYSEYGSVPDFSGALEMAFAFIRAALDRDAQAWNEKSAVRAEAGRNGGLAKARNAKQRLANEANLAVPVPDNVPVSDSIKVDKPSRSRFVPPTTEEVRAYCQERHSSVDPEAFVSFYESNGWMVGKNHMKNWRSAVLSWERRNKLEQKGEGKNDYWA